MVISNLSVARFAISKIKFRSLTQARVVGIRFFKNQNLVSGFTLIEVVVSIAILGILAAIALPSFTETIRRFRVNAIRDDLTTTLQFAKSEAIRRNLPFSTPLVIERITTCDADTKVVGVWTCGWQIFQDVNNNQTFDAGDVLLQQTSVPSGYSVIHDSANFIVANRWGQMSGESKFVIAPIISGAISLSDNSAAAICLGVAGVIKKVTPSTLCP